MFAQIFTVIAVIATVKAGAISVVSGGLGVGGLGLGGGLALGGGLGGLGLGHGVSIAARPAVVDVHTPAHYEFKYGVADGHTGDQKQQAEVRVGDTVKGEYSLAEPDGTIRVVKYTADPHNGFNAVVSRIGHAAHPQIVASHGVALGGIGLGGHGLI
ncbi:adult-specific cuticular protein ACP-20-like [Anoplophora glabripennis]|uniref:adult-specific cuticular protein ACP-20-like n=1 Tax=Anoplophora glabripennis TaxID=217634 RepID=UPI000A135278|nr:adult-specific cuticular protein ACP-20-like [Anoplophora glabripennis]